MQFSFTMFIKMNTIIPRFESNPAIPGRMRYKVSEELANVSFTSADAVALAGVMAATTSTVWPIARTARIKRVEIWAPAILSTSNTPGYCSIFSNSEDNASGGVYGNSGPRKIVQDETISSTYAAHVVYQPRRNEISGAWHSPNTLANAAVLFSVSCSPGAIIDIWYDFVLNSGNFVSAGVSISVSSTAVVGKSYKRPWLNSISVMPVNAFSVIT